MVTWDGKRLIQTELSLSDSGPMRKILFKSKTGDVDGCGCRPPSLVRARARSQLSSPWRRFSIFRHSANRLIAWVIEYIRSERAKLLTDLLRARVYPARESKCTCRVWIYFPDCFYFSTSLRRIFNCSEYTACKSGEISPGGFFTQVSEESGKNRYMSLFFPGRNYLDVRKNYSYANLTRTLRNIRYNIHIFDLYIIF